MSDALTDNFYTYRHIRNDTNEVFYIGKGKGSRAFQSSNRNRYWKNIVNKTDYTVELLTINMNEKDSLELEILLISEYKRYGTKLSNLTNGGEGVSGLKDTEETKKLKSLKATGRVMSPESIAKSKESNKGRASPRKGAILTQEQKDKISIGNTGKNPSKKARERMSIASKGKPKSEEHRKNIATAKRNLSVETIKRMRSSAKLREQKKRLYREGLSNV